MQPSDRQIDQIFTRKVRLVVPVYQRLYSWKEEQCNRLWEDIKRVYDSIVAKRDFDHFLGYVILDESSNKSTDTFQKIIYVIDGQQRLTSIMLFILALRDTVEDDDVRDDLNKLVKGSKGLLFEPTPLDNEFYVALAEGQPYPASKCRIIENYEIFKRHLKTLKASPAGLNEEYMKDVLERLQVVEIKVDEKDRDYVSTIFSSLNSTGKKLAESDKIRNFLMMSFDEDEQELKYKESWRVVAEMVDKRNGRDVLTDFFCIYLEHKTRNNIPKHDVYAVFREFFDKQLLSSSKSKRDLAQEILDELLIFAKAWQQYEAINANDRGTVQELVYATKVVTKGAAYHYVIPAYYKFVKGDLAEMQLVEMLRLIVSYLANLSIASMQFSGSNKEFSRLNWCLNAEDPLTAFRGAFYQSFARYYPSEKALRNGFSKKSTLTNDAKLYLLKEIENYQQKENLHSSWLKVVSIIPTKKEPTGRAYQESIESWKKARGNDYEDKAIIGSLSNLTLVKSDNKVVEDWSSFEVKKEQMKLCAHNRLNKTISSSDVWTNDVIEERINLMYEAATMLWPKPDISDLNIDNEVSSISEAELKNKECFDNALSQSKAAEGLYLALNEAIYQDLPENDLRFLFKAKNKTVLSDDERILLSFTVNSKTSSVRLHCLINELEKFDAFNKLNDADGVSFVAKELKNDSVVEAVFKNGPLVLPEQDLIVEVVTNWLRSQLTYE